MKQSRKGTKFCLVSEQQLMKELDVMNVEGRENLKTKLELVEALVKQQTPEHYDEMNVEVRENVKTKLEVVNFLEVTPEENRI